MKLNQTLRLAAFAVAVAVLVFLLLQVLAGGHVPNSKVKECVLHESASIRAEVDSRSDAIEARLERIESKLDKLDGKLDRILELATPKLPDGMKEAE